MERKVIFRDTQTGEELTLPVTPQALQAESSVSDEITNISQLGDINLPGKGTLAALSLECLFPAQAYPFCCVAPLQPYEYVEKFKAWAAGRRVLRFVWAGTPVNIPVTVTGIMYSEEDGTNDVTAAIKLREYRYITAALEPLATAAEEPVREDTPTDTSIQTYIVVWGDTLGAISRKFYGDASLYPQLAAYNKIANPHLIHPGDIIKIPPASAIKPATGNRTRATTKAAAGVAQMSAAMALKLKNTIDAKSRPR